MPRRKYYPHGDRGEVRDYLDSLRRDPQRKKAAVKLDIDIQSIELFWPRPPGVKVRMMRGWEPLWELKRLYDKVAYRIFFCLCGDELWLLSACEKRSAKTPRRELERARRRMLEVIRSTP